MSPDLNKFSNLGNLAIEFLKPYIDDLIIDAYNMGKGEGYEEGYEDGLNQGLLDSE